MEKKFICFSVDKDVYEKLCGYSVACELPLPEFAKAVMIDFLQHKENPFEEIFYGESKCSGSLFDELV